jgi:hypothetical protein
MKKLIFVLALFSLSAAQAADPIADGAMLHQEYTEVDIASDLCAGVKMDIKKWDEELRKVAGSKGPCWVKSFVVSPQGEAYYGKRYDEFKADTAKNCAEAQQVYGPKGKGLLIKK